MFSELAGTILLVQSENFTNTHRHTQVLRQAHIHRWASGHTHIHIYSIFTCIHEHKYIIMEFPCLNGTKYSD